MGWSRRPARCRTKRKAMCHIRQGVLAAPFCSRPFVYMGADYLRRRSNREASRVPRVWNSWTKRISSRTANNITRYLYR